MENLRSGNMLSVLGVIMQLRKCCNHPNLFEPRAVLSPFVARTITARFIQNTIQIEKGMKEEMPYEVLFRNAYSSELAWKLLTRISRFDKLQSTSNNNLTRHQSLSPTIGLKFVINESGGHFFRPKQIQPMLHGCQFICNGEGDRVSSLYYKMIRNIEFPVPERIYWRYAESTNKKYFG